jgi:hypothetical protein
MLQINSPLHTVDKLYYPFQLYKDIIIIMGAKNQGGSWPAQDNASIGNGQGRYFSSF